ncbi:photosystem II assembly protein [Anabaena sp. CCY 9910]|uniref:photosystem II assembly protein n=1 Tax=Anabaena sp. CCY 9910 TaxID=3103870 RepID=UPI0039E07C1C
MINPIANWWRSQQFKLAVIRGDTRKSLQILHDIQKSGARFSWLEKLFRDRIKFERLYQEYKDNNKNLKEKQESKANLGLIPNKQFIDFVCKEFNLVKHDQYKLQCTGIQKHIFEDLEVNLVEYINDEFSRFSQQKLMIKIEDAIDDIDGLKKGKDPDYRFSLTPHVYFMKYFLDNVYCVYLAWFLIYQDGLINNKINILDIAAGPGTVAYSLALLLQSISEFTPLPQTHISYYSLEKQDSFQYRGLQFWRKYIESQTKPINTYYRFVTTDILNWQQKPSNLPENFFDFIVISHCFFSDPDVRLQAHNTYKQIFETGLNEEGYVLLIIQDKKLFKIYNLKLREDQEQEKNTVIKFVSELGLKLVWYQYLTSRDSRNPCSAVKFAQFAEHNLPKQVYMTPLLQKYFGQKYQSSYTLDDYVILAKK